MIAREINLLEICLRIGLAMILGGLIGIDRSLKNRPAGLRTHLLVSVGSCLIMVMNQYIYQVFGTGDPTRMGAQVVSGIGFLGAGTIIISHDRKITGLTTAASLWACAAVGLALGIGFYEGALIGFGAIFVSVILLMKFDGKLEGLQKSIEIYVELYDTYSLKDFLYSMYDEGYSVHHVQIDDRNQKNNHITVFLATIQSDKTILKEDMNIILEKSKEVALFEIL